MLLCMPQGPLKDALRQRRWSVLAGVVLLGACAGTPASRLAVYDLGLAAVPIPGTENAGRGPFPPVVLADVDVPPVLDGTGVLYRLAYRDVQQLKPYAQARWAMPPAYMLRQKVRQTLSARRPVASPADAGAARLPLLRLEMEEFSQVFDSPDHCHALVRVRATLSQAPLNALPQGPGPAPGLVALPVAAVPALLVQTNLVQQVVCPTADAAGGARALAQASDALAGQLDTWLSLVSPSAP